MNKYISKLNYLRVAPRKVRAVGDLIKGLSVNEAEAQLMFQRRRPAKSLLKLLRSAVATAKNNQSVNSEKLYVESLRVDQGPMMKRILPRAKGTATPIQKKMSHVTLVLAENLNLGTPRFKIVVPKKTKLPPEERPKNKKSKKEMEDKREAVPSHKHQDAGFFKRVFNRKSSTGK